MQILHSGKPANSAEFLNRSIQPALCHRLERPPIPLLVMNGLRVGAFCEGTAVKRREVLA